MPENLPRMPSVETEKRVDQDGFPGTIPSRDPDANGDPRAHHQVKDDARDRVRTDASPSTLDSTAGDENGHNVS